jgi:prepilin-type processing-associated H-X9-DG protein
MKMKRFTLIELVFIVFILFILSAMATPVVCKRKSLAQLSNCTGNMKQLGIAGALYGLDNQKVFPGPQPMGVEIAKVSWDRLLAIQVGTKLGGAGIYEPVATLTKTPPHADTKTLATFTCPSDPQAQGAAIGKEAKTLDEGMANGNNLCRSYTLNLGSANLDGGNADDISFTAAAIPVSKVESPAGTVYLIENHGYATVFGAINKINDTILFCTKEPRLGIATDFFTNSKIPMHAKSYQPPQFNALMYDGHVEILKQADILAKWGKLMQYHK